MRDLGRESPPTVPRSLLDEALLWLRRASSRGRLLLAYHADLDGLVASVFMQQALELQGVDRERIEPLSVATYDFTFEPLLEIASSRPFVSAAFLDINLLSRSRIIPQLTARFEGAVLVYDDHVVPEGAVVGRAAFLNPTRLVGPELPLPACWFGYELLTRVGLPTTDAHRWSVAAALLSERVYDLYSCAYAEIQFSPELLQRVVGLLHRYYSYPRASGDKAREALQEAIRLNVSLQQFLDDGLPQVAELRRIENLVGGEVRHNTSMRDARSWKVGAEGYSVVVKPVESPFHIIHLVASNLRNRIELGVVIAYQDHGDRTVLELRRTHGLERIDLAAVLDDAARRVPFVNHGGHPAAAGGSVAKTDRESALEAINSSLPD